MPKILCFTPLPSNSEVTLYTIDDETFESKLKICILNKNADIPRKNVKAVIFRFTKGEQKESSKLAEMLEEYYSKYKTPFFCCSWNSIYLSAALMAVEDEFGEATISDDMDFIFCVHGCLGYFKVVLIKSVFQITWTNLLPIHEEIELTLKLMGPLSQTFIHCPTPTPESPFTKTVLENDDDFITTELKNSGPLQNLSAKEVQQSIIEALLPKDTTVIKTDIKNYLPKSIVLKALNLLGEKSFKFNVANNGFKNFALTTGKVMRKMGDISNMNRFIIKILVSDIAPVKRTLVYYKELEKVLLVGPTGMEFSLLNQKFEPGATLKLSLDKHFLFNSYIKNDNRFTKNAAFICLKNNLISVDLVRNGKLEKNVIHGIPAAVSFVNENIQFGEKAMEMFEDFNTYLITDLIKIMIVENLSDLEIDDGWGFTVTQNEKDEIYLEFETFRGRRKATPAFLFALILKWIILNVKTKFGQMPDTVVIVSKELNENFKKQLEISFKNTKLEITDFQIQHHKVIEIYE